jgi:hypothetical protein
MSTQEEVKYFVTKPVGGIIPTSQRPSDHLMVGTYAEPKIGCCDNGQKTREDRVVIVFDDEPHMHQHMLSFGNHTTISDDKVLNFRIYNRRGTEYRVANGASKAAITKLKPLYDRGFRVFDCGYFPQGERAGDLALYGLPTDSNAEEGIRPYDQMRMHMERHYPIYLDKRILKRFRDNMSSNLRHYSSGLVTLDDPGRRSYKSLRELLFKGTPQEHEDDTDPYWYDINDHEDPQVYILPAWKSGPYLNYVWEAMLDEPDTTYEGMVIKPANQFQVHTPDKPQRGWMKIRYR